MILGLRRSAAAEFSFLAGVPVIAAATAYELSAGGAWDGEDAVSLAVGVVVATISGVVAVKAFTAFLARSTMTAFAWYRIALAVAVLAIVA
jgi:undecaprenyl-diphosphatase